MKKLIDRVEAMAESLELPSEAMLGELKLSMVGGSRALVENHRGILSFEESCISVAAKRGRLVFRGDGLYLAAMSSENLMICGKIQTVEWE